MASERMKTVRNPISGTDVTAGERNTGDHTMATIANNMDRQLALRESRHSYPFTNDELRERVSKAIANRTFDSSLKLRPLLPKQIDAAPLLQKIELPPIRQFFNEVLNPIVRSVSVPALILDGLPLKVFEICEKYYMMQKMEGQETVQTMTRMTQDGRELTYRLEMCQQPRQARACGNGARSSADRRPVDPPPVISLTIKHGNIDITSSYEAAFMLFASLHHSRPYAQGRLAPTHTCPVITGVCVAGAAYLARPSNAAYFIFPDLSVRHEGFYNLRFHLFEQTKRIGDMDEGITMTPAEASNFENPLPGKEHENMVNRLSITSDPFQVFSAKKFPGLQPSTELSKVIADQGCRVRIRREVRQRRAGERKGKDDDLSHRDIYNYQRDGSHDSQHDFIQPGPPRDQRRMSVDSQASHSYALTRHPSYSHSTMPSPALPGPSRYGQTAPTTPIVAEAEHKYGHAYAMPPLRQPPVQRGQAPALSPVSTSGMSTLPSMKELLGTPTEPSRPIGGLYSLPPPIAQKRGARSPEPSSAVLKDGARPMMAPSRAGSGVFGGLPIPAHAHESRMSLCYGDAVIQPDDDDDDNDDGSGDEILDNPYTYRRATGDKVTHMTSMRTALQLWRRS